MGRGGGLRGGLFFFGGGRCLKQDKMRVALWFSGMPGKPKPTHVAPGSKEGVFWSWRTHKKWIPGFLSASEKTIPPIGNLPKRDVATLFDGRV